MSTFTTIKTAIRDAGTMGRILRSLPGARVDENVAVPVKSGGFERVAFRVAFGDSPVSAWGVIGQALRGKMPDVRLFFVERTEDGTFKITINQDLAAHDSMYSVVQEAVGSSAAASARALELSENVTTERSEVQSVHDAIGSSSPASTRSIELSENAAPRRSEFQEKERLEKERQLARKRQEDERLSEEARRQHERDAAAQQERDRLTQREQEAKRQVARSAAAPVLAQLDARRAQVVPAPATTVSKPVLSAAEQQAASAAWGQALAQQYAREKVLEQLDDVQRQHGVSLGGIETLEDGTIEITLKG